MASSMALRSAAAATTTASSLLRKFLINPTTLSALPHHHGFIFPPPPVYLAFNRSFTTTTSSSDNKDSDSVADSDSPVIVQGSPQKFKMENPFQSGGPGNVIEVDEVNNGMLVRVALPGVGEKGIKVWAENNTLYFAGKGEIEYENEDSGRKYGGSLEFQPEEHRADGFNAEMKNGILRLLVPKAEIKEKNGA